MPGTGEVSLGGPDEQLNVTNNLRVIPGDVGAVRLGVTYPFDTPVYWQLPKQFLGDRVRICMHFQYCTVFVRFCMSLVLYLLGW
jgi:hypothetical protein